MNKNNLSKKITNIEINNLYQTKTNKSVKNLIKKINGWSYIFNSKTNINKIQKLIDISEKIILLYYSEEMLEFDLNDLNINSLNCNSFESSNIYRNEIIEKISIYSKRIIKKLNIEDNNILYKLSSEKYTYIISINVSDKSIKFNTFIYDNKLLILKICFDNLEDSIIGKEMFRLESTPLYLSKKDRYISELIKDDYNGIFTDNETLNIIYKSLKMIYDKKEIPMSTYTRCQKAEIYFLNKIIEKRHKEYGFQIELHNWIEENNNKKYSFINNINELEMINKTVIHADKSYPLIDLSLKDIDYIRNYMMSIKLFDDGINLNKHMSFIYGNTFRYLIELEDKTNFTISIVISKNDENDYLRITFSYDVNESIRIFSYIDYTDISNFTNNCFKINTSILIMNNKNIYLSIDDIKNEIPILFIDPDNIRSIALNIIGLCILLNDQPSKMRMIKCTKNNTNNNAKKENDKKNNNDFIVSRILTTSKGINRCINRMRSTYKVDKGYEYILESWPRKGFYRTDSSGKQIWVPPTVCHRHLPLTEKEIHIKL